MFLKYLIRDPKDYMILPTEDLVILSLSGKAMNYRWEFMFDFWAIYVTYIDIFCNLLIT